MAMPRVTAGSGSSQLSLGSENSCCLLPGLFVAWMAAGTLLCIVMWKISKGTNGALLVVNADCLHVLSHGCDFQVSNPRAAGHSSTCDCLQPPYPVPALLKLIMPPPNSPELIGKPFPTTLPTQNGFCEGTQSPILPPRSPQQPDLSVLVHKADLGWKC